MSRKGDADCHSQANQILENGGFVVIVDGENEKDKMEEERGNEAGDADAISPE